MISRRSTTSLFQLKSNISQHFFSNGLTIDEKQIGSVRKIYEKWLNDPNNVSPVWDSFFKTVSHHERARSKSNRSEPLGDFIKVKEVEKLKDIDLEQFLLVQELIKSYQIHGHRLAKLNPLDINSERSLISLDEHTTLLKKVKSELKLSNNFSLKSLTTYINENEDMSLKEIINRLENIYCSSIGLEYMHLSNFKECDFIRKQFETPNVFKLTKDQKRLLFTRLTRTFCFEKFLNTHCNQSNTFNSLEGCEILIPCIKTIIDQSTDYGVDHFIFGMSQRGRLNILANIFGIPLLQLMVFFHQNENFISHLGTDQVKLNTVSNKKTRLTMMIGPSDMNITAGVTLGRSKIEQMFKSENQILPVLIHEDNETLGILNLSVLSGFNTGGIIHVVLNDNSYDSESQTTKFCSSLAKSIDAPVFHVNADNPEAVQKVSKIAANWRSIFKKDCIINLMFCNRSIDFIEDLMITHPKSSLKIKNKPSVIQEYFNQLKRDGVITQNEAQLKLTGWEKGGKNLVKTVGKKNGYEDGKKNEYKDRNKNEYQNGKKNEHQDGKKNDYLGNSEEAEMIKKDYREIFEEIEKAECDRIERRRMIEKMKEMKRKERIKFAEKLLNRKKKKPKKD